MTDERFEALKSALSKISEDDMRDYISKGLNGWSDGEKTQFVIKFICSKQAGNKSYGLIPLTRAVQETFKPDMAPAQNLEKRIRENQIEDLDELNKKISEMSDKEQRLEAQIKELNERNQALKLASSRVSELESELKRLKEINEQLAKTGGQENQSNTSSDVAKLFEQSKDKNMLENYEKALNAWILGRKLALPEISHSGSKESEDAQRIHDYLLIRWFLYDRDPKTLAQGCSDPNEFNKKWKEIMDLLDKANGKSIDFFQEYFSKPLDPLSRMGKRR